MEFENGMLKRLANNSIKRKGTKENKKLFIDNYYKKKVIAKSGYDPKIYPKKSKLASVLLTFIQEFNKMKKFRS